MTGFVHTVSATVPWWLCDDAGSHEPHVVNVTECISFMSNGDINGSGWCVSHRLWHQHLGVTHLCDLRRPYPVSSCMTEMQDKHRCWLAQCLKIKSNRKMFSFSFFYCFFSFVFRVRCFIGNLRTTMAQVFLKKWIIVGNFLKWYCIITSTGMCGLI